METICRFLGAFYDWPFGAVLVITAIAIILLITYMLCCVILTALDTWFLPKKQGLGKVVKKKFIHDDASSLLALNYALRPYTSVPNIRPDKWKLTVEIDGVQDTISVDGSLYNSVSVGDPVKAEYVIGRHSKDLYLKSLSLA